MSHAPPGDDRTRPGRGSGSDVDWLDDRTIVRAQATYQHAMRRRLARVALDARTRGDVDSHAIALWLLEGAA